ncbi:MAG: ATP-binding protein [Methylovirgula sp.]
MSIEDPEDLNPFVHRLPPRIGKPQQFRLLRRLPLWSAEERALSHIDRRHRVLRLLDYMDPLNGQLDLVERFDMAIRQGYRGRNPSTLSYRRSLIESANDIAAGRDPLAPNDSVRVVAEAGYEAVYPAGDPRAPRMPGFSILGCPGMGKSATIERILHNYPLIIRHTDTADMIVQVPALKIECPSTGSRKSFCIEFFRLLDERLEQQGKLAARYGKSTRTVEEMLANVQHFVRLNAIGTLIVDEIQNLTASKEGIAPLVNFLVAMANKIGVGIVMIGTMAAKDIPQAAFHSARRATGLGGFVWDPMQRGKEWDTFVKTMWKFQWTNIATPLHEELNAALFEHSQGVIDILIKLFILAQLRVITNSELSGTPEAITCEVIEAVARDELAMVSPMIEALRTGDYELLDRYTDLKPFHEYFGSLVKQTTGSSVENIRARLTAEEAAVRARAEAPDDERKRFYVEMLKSLGLTNEAAKKTLEEILSKVDPLDVIAISRAVAEAAEINKKKPSQKSTRPLRAVADRVKIAGDLRDILSGLPTGMSMHEALSKVGVACTPREAIAR